MSLPQLLFADHGVVRIQTTLKLLLNLSFFDRLYNTEGLGFFS